MPTPIPDFCMRSLCSSVISESSSCAIANAAFFAWRSFLGMAGTTGAACHCRLAPEESLAAKRIHASTHVRHVPHLRPRSRSRGVTDVCRRPADIFFSLWWQFHGRTRGALRNVPSGRFEASRAARRLSSSRVTNLQNSIQTSSETTGPPNSARRGRCSLERLSGALTRRPPMEEAEDDHLPSMETAAMVGRYPSHRSQRSPRTAARHSAQAHSRRILTKSDT